MQPTGTATNNKIYSVSKLTTEIKSLLEQKFPFVWISGEVSNFSIPVSGHYYFTLKDDHAQISAVMFRGQNRHLKFTPKDGMQIVGLGRLSVYEPRGSYQVIFELLEPKGIGAYQIAYEQLKAKLLSEGLFDEEHKRPIPYLPSKISVITSPTGAVVHDIIQIITRRFPSTHLEIVPVKVQGDLASGEIIAALDLLNDRKDADVLILARGGGSIEDLAAFNTEEVARKVFNSVIPIVSAIGHETDFTITDFVSDLRAPTPSAAAELVVPVKADLKGLCQNFEKSLTSCFYYIIKRYSMRISELAVRLADPRRKIQDFRLRVDDLTIRLIRQIQKIRLQRGERLFFWHDRLMANNPIALLKIYHEKLDLYNNNMLYFMVNLIKQKKHQLREKLARLQALNPKSILKRGFSITRTIPDLVVVKDSDSVNIGQKLDVLLASGTLTCWVGGKKKNGQENI
ncbi:exodeoxyribonuclease VII large subunit [Thermodesulfobacteriota bacterium]